MFANTQLPLSKKYPSETLTGCFPNKQVKRQSYPSGQRLVEESRITHPEYYVNYVIQ